MPSTTWRLVLTPGRAAPTRRPRGQRTNRQATTTCLSPPLIRLGAAPSGRITVDFRGEATGSYPNTVAGIVKRILLQAGVSSGDIDDASFTALDTGGAL